MGKAPQVDTSRKRTKRNSGRKELTLGQVLRRRRQQLEMNQRQLAERVGCQGNYIGYLESGVRRPSQTLLLKLARRLH